jgi:DNA invertase Pin-like site-specific DNA recombinase
MGIRIAIYSRGSTDIQDTANQLVQLRAFAATQDWTVVREYVDIASGKGWTTPTVQGSFRSRFTQRA